MSNWVEILEETRELLNMDANSFYQSVIAFVGVLISALSGGIVLLFNGIKYISRDYKKSKLLKIYYKKETDNFYVYVMLVEFVDIIFGFLIGVIISACINHFFWYCKFEFRLDFKDIMLISIMVVVGLTLQIRKMPWVKKRILGDKFGKMIIWCSIISICIATSGTLLGGKLEYFGVCFMFIYLLIELIGVSYFRSRYEEYLFSKIRIHLQDGSYIVCEYIERLKRKKNYLIVDNIDTATVVEYDKIDKVEYYGPLKIIMRDNTLLANSFYKAKNRPTPNDVASTYNNINI